MPFKFHLLIVSAIIATVFTIWQLTTPPVSKADPQTGSKIITVTHASLGLNCRQFSTNTDNSKLAPDNVLESTSKKCNGHSECAISLDNNDLGEDPAPDCKPKTLEVEYRCFSYDRPRQLKATTGSLQLTCISDKK